MMSIAMAALVGCAGRAHGPKPAGAPMPIGSLTGVLASRVGLASYYGQRFHGKASASGVKFDMNAMVAAHPSYPFGTLVRVTNLRNGQSTSVEIVDRGPASGPQAEGVIIDVSRRVAQALGFTQAGRTRVRLEVLQWGHQERE
jgi:rare lipoprotein A